MSDEKKTVNVPEAGDVEIHELRVGKLAQALATWAPIIERYALNPFLMPAAGLEKIVDVTALATGVDAQRIRELPYDALRQVWRAILDANPALAYWMPELPALSIAAATSATSAADAPSADETAAPSGEAPPSDQTTTGA